jgi:enoyl-CoA hydratase/carnithine racemase
MIDDTNLRVDRNGPQVTVTMSRPDSLNALTRNLLVDLGVVMKDLADNDAVRVVVLTGAGRAFSSEVDLRDL